MWLSTMTPLEEQLKENGPLIYVSTIAYFEFIDGNVIWGDLLKKAPWPSIMQLVHLLH